MLKERHRDSQFDATSLYLDASFAIGVSSSSDSSQCCRRGSPLSARITSADFAAE